jgi:hypothetical protein
MKRAMTIDEAVRWAYREELPKSRQRAPEEMGRGFGNASTGTNIAADWWTLPDNIYGVVIDPSKWDDPHSDAIAIHQAVMALDELPVIYPEEAAAVRGWVGMDLHGHELRCAAEVFRVVRRRKPSELVHLVALLGLPDMIVDPFEVKFETHANGRAKYYRKEVIMIDGQPVEREIDGFNPKSQRPYPDAYRKYYLEPDPVPSLIGRAKAEIWRSAMDVLFLDLEGQLVEVVLKPCGLPELPWEKASAIVHRDLRPRIVARPVNLHSANRRQRRAAP